MAAGLLLAALAGQFAQHRVVGIQVVVGVVRVGVPVGDARDTLLYFKGGYTNARFTAESNGVEASTDEDGYRLGAGVEHKFGTNVSAKVEYRYSDYGDGVNRNQVVAGIGYRF